MTTTGLITIFDRHHRSHRTVREWQQTARETLGDGAQWTKLVRSWARMWGEAKVLRADGSVVRDWNEEGILRQRTYRRVALTP